VQFVQNGVERGIDLLPVVRVASIEEAAVVSVSGNRGSGGGGAGGGFSCDLCRVKVINI